MARIKIQEYKAKQLVYPSLEVTSEMISYKDSSELSNLKSDKTYVVKVDQGVKGRLKKGLVALDKKSTEIKSVIESFEKQGYSSFFIEEFIPHENSDELYLAIERVREGKKILYSKIGGIDIEKNKDQVTSKVIKNNKETLEISQFLNLEESFLQNLLDLFDNFYFSFLEINPLVLVNDKVHILDLAVEVDSTAEFFVKGAWSESDFVFDVKPKTKEEEEVLKLSAKSQAAFKLDVINPNGSVFMLLSGGGASIVLADEVYNLGKAKELANYGEYSGNPNAEETYIYTKNLLSLLLKSTSPKKVLIVGGGVANFTDIRLTFKGVIKAMEEVAKDLEKQKVKVFVRRGGPHQKEGLEIMETFLKNNNLLGIVCGPEMVLTEIVIKALNYD